MEKAQKIVFQAIDQVNLMRKQDDKLQKEENFKLSGEDGVLDSLGLVNLIVAIEEAAEDIYDLEITLAQDATFSMNNAFSSVGMLIKTVNDLVTEGE